MKIAFLNIYQDQVDRGAETFVKELSKRLSKKHSVDIISGKRMPVRRIPVLWRAFIDPQGLHILWFSIKSIPRILKQRYDVVIPLNSGWQVAFIRIATWLYGGKMVISGQSGAGWDDANNLWSFPNAFIALSEKAANWAKRVNPIVRVEKISNGVDTNKFKPKGKKYKVDLEKPVILTVSALEKAKRLELVIKRVSDYKKASLFVVGDGPQRRKLKVLGRALLQSRFYLEKVPFEKMQQVYRAADAFVLVSKPQYSFEIVLVEAMATGLPVIANKDEIRKEIVGDAGILVDPENNDEFINAIDKVLTKKWRGKPRKQAKKFEWDTISEKYEKLFKSLIK
jgi:glycosyltransferase involved in cell wall biosynthesis